VKLFLTLLQVGVYSPRLLAAPSGGRDTVCVLALAFREIVEHDSGDQHDRTENEVVVDPVDHNLVAVKTEVQDVEENEEENQAEGGDETHGGWTVG
jgi:hypothetical protein